MARRISLLLALAVGYVLGARAGREHYDKIMDKAQQLWQDPRVQKKADQAQHLVQEKAGQATEVVKDKVASATSSAHQDPAAGTSGGTGGGSLP